MQLREIQNIKVLKDTYSKNTYFAFNTNRNIFLSVLINMYFWFLALFVCCVCSWVPMTLPIFVLINKLTVRNLHSDLAQGMKVSQTKQGCGCSCKHLNLFLFLFFLFHMSPADKPFVSCRTHIHK